MSEKWLVVKLYNNNPLLSDRDWTTQVTKAGFRIMIQFKMISVLHPNKRKANVQKTWKRKELGRYNTYPAHTSWQQGYEWQALVA